MTNRKVWLAVIGAVVVTAAVVSGGWLYLHRGERPLATAAAPKADPVPVTLKPFTVNLAGDDGRLLYVAMTVQAGNQTTADFINSHIPEVRNEVLMILSGQRAGALLTPSGKTALATTLSIGLTKALRGPRAGFAVKQVFFTQFIVQ